MQPAESVAVKLKEKSPALVGVPAITPDGEIVKPAGRLPEAKANV